jgi:hypothetical protein
MPCTICCSPPFEEHGADAFHCRSRFPPGCQGVRSRIKMLRRLYSFPPLSPFVGADQSPPRFWR